MFNIEQKSFPAPAKLNARREETRRYLKGEAMLSNRIPGKQIMLLGWILAGSILLSTVLAQSPTDTTARQPATAAAPSRYRLNQIPMRAQMYYQGLWGVDSLNVKLAESGELVRFSYRVIDANKAKPLNDKKAEPALIDQQAGVQLVIPTMQNVGQLRQTSTPEAGKSYWMAFSNKGRLVKRGDRVIVSIGPFRADWLVVQ
jgi:hypothetical protein